MSYAIIQLQGKQYQVQPDDVLTVDRLESDKEVIITDVLLFNDGKHTKVGTPILPKAKVVAEVISHDKAKKITVFKYKSKSRDRRTQGHRQLQTTLKIKSIEG